jgi:hypothetical protein
VESITNSSSCYEYFGSTSRLLRSSKKSRVEHLFSITIGYLATVKGTKDPNNWKRMSIVDWLSRGIHSLGISSCSTAPRHVSLLIKKLKAVGWKLLSIVPVVIIVLPARICSVGFLIPSEREVNVVLD